MKKEDVTGLIVYLLIVGIALVFCFTVLREHSTHSGLDFFPYWLYIVGAVLSGVLFKKSEKKPYGLVPFIAAFVLLLAAIGGLIMFIAYAKSEDSASTASTASTALAIARLYI